MEIIYYGVSEHSTQTEPKWSACTPLKNNKTDKEGTAKAGKKALKLLAICLSIIVSSTNVKAQPREYHHTSDSVTISKNRYSFDIPIILIASGVAITTFDNSLHDIRKQNYPTFKHSYDDYTQYLPAALMLSLKTFGVESRSSWGQMLLSDALSVGITTLSVNGLKYLIDRQRPDGSANNSFPSGHTATAFMTATMLHKEYGDKSPWYSAIAYTCASVTGVTRWLNNRHWVGDIFVGAGIGILSVELGYLLGDIILKKPHSTSFFKALNTKERRPSFVAFQMGARIDFLDYALDNGDQLKIENGCHTGIEGAWYPHKRFGVGGQLVLSSYQYHLESQSTPLPYEAYTLSLGVYNSQPLFHSIRVESRALVGRDIEQKKGALNELIEINNGLLYTFGSSLSYWGKEHFQFKLYCDYILHHNMFSNSGMHELSAGLAMMYMFN